MVYKKTILPDLSQLFGKSLHFGAALLFLFTTGCSLPEASVPSPGLNEFSTGTAFVVNLPENHQDGATWHLSRDFNKEMVAEMSSTWHGPETGIYFNFRTLSVGQTTLNFVKRMYNDTLGVKSFIVKISAE